MERIQVMGSLTTTTGRISVLLKWLKDSTTWSSRQATGLCLPQGVWKGYPRHSLRAMASIFFFWPMSAGHPRGMTQFFRIKFVIKFVPGQHEGAERSKHVREA